MPPEDKTAPQTANEAPPARSPATDLFQSLFGDDPKRQDVLTKSTEASVLRDNATNETITKPPPPLPLPPALSTTTTPSTGNENEVEEPELEEGISPAAADVTTAQTDAPTTTKPQSQSEEAKEVSGDAKKGPKKPKRNPRRKKN